MKRRSRPIWKALGVPAFPRSTRGVWDGSPGRAIWYDAGVAGRLFNFASALSAMLWLAIAAMCVRSYFQPPVSWFPAGAPALPSYRGWYLRHGSLSISKSESLVKPEVIAAYPGYPYGGQVGSWDAMGLSCQRETIALLRPKDRSLVMIVSRATVFTVWLGLPLLLSAILPACWLIRKWIRGRRKPAGVCRVCGYDLRASKERCPECGTPTSALSSERESRTC